MWGDFSLFQVNREGRPAHPVVRIIEKDIKIEIRLKLWKGKMKKKEEGVFSKEMIDHYYELYEKMRAKKP